MNNTTTKNLGVHAKLITMLRKNLTTIEYFSAKRDHKINLLQTYRQKMSIKVG